MSSKCYITGFEDKEDKEWLQIISVVIVEMKESQHIKSIHAARVVDLLEIKLKEMRQWWQKEKDHMALEETRIALFAEKLESQNIRPVADVEVVCLHLGKKGFSKRELPLASPLLVLVEALYAALAMQLKRIGLQDIVILVNAKRPMSFMRRKGNLLNMLKNIKKKLEQDIIKIHCLNLKKLFNIQQSNILMLAF